MTLTSGKVQSSCVVLWGIAAVSLLTLLAQGRELTKEIVAGRSLAEWSAELQSSSTGKPPAGA